MPKTLKKDYIDTTTNAALMTPEKLDQSWKGDDKINISIDGMDNAKYLEFVKTK